MTSDTPTPRPTTREAWLAEALSGLRVYFKECGYEVPEARASVGFGSQGRRAKADVQSFSAEASDTRHVEMFTRPENADPGIVLAKLAEELVSVVASPDAGRGRGYRRIAIAVGFTGRMMAPIPSPRLQERLNARVRELGPFDHSPLDAEWEAINKSKPQTTRLMSGACAVCGYRAWTTRLWLSRAGAPKCPIHQSLEMDKPFQAPAGEEVTDRQADGGPPPPQISTDTSGEIGPLEVDKASSAIPECSPAQPTPSHVEALPGVQWTARFRGPPPDEVRTSLKGRFAARYDRDTRSWHGIATNEDLPALRAFVEPNAGILEVSH